jgi:hypothetical protein
MIFYDFKIFFLERKKELNTKVSSMEEKNTAIYKIFFLKRK